MINDVEVVLMIISSKQNVSNTLLTEHPLNFLLICIVIHHQCIAQRALTAIATGKLYLG